MNKLGLIIFAILANQIFTQNLALADEAKPNIKEQLIKNAVSIEDAQLKAGDIVLVQPIHKRADYLFATPKDISSGNDVSKYDNVTALKSPYRQTHITRTWLDYENQLAEYAKSQNLGNYTDNERAIVAERLYKLKGVRPLRSGQVSVALSGNLETTYNLEDLALTKHISTNLFEIGEKVYFTVKANGGSFQQQGVIAGIKTDGTILVQKGMQIAAVSIDEIFSAERSYQNQRFKLNEEVTYIFKRVASAIVTEESGKVIAVSPNGSIIINVKKIGQTIKISIKDSSVEAERNGTNLIRKLPMACGNLFI